MDERTLAEILAIRSLEETDPNFFPPDVQLDALIVSGKEEDDLSLIQKRAQHLFQKLPDALKDIPFTVHIPRPWAAGAYAGMFMLGIALNYLGPGDKIHVIYNPVVLLLVWNICIFAVFFLRHFFPKEKPGAENTSRRAGTDDQDTAGAGTVEPAGQGYTSSAFFRMFRRLWFMLHGQMLKKKEDMKLFPSLLRMTSRYLELWWDMNRPVSFSRFARFIHILAVFLIAGALSGIYIRGLFLEYNVIWKSTFIHDPHDIAGILNLFFGPASYVLQGRFIDEAAVMPLLGPNGEPAARWIHFFAVSAFIFVVPCRLLLAFLESRKIRFLSRSMTINPEETYYARCIGIAREMQANRLREEIAVVVQDTVAKMAGSVALFACERFYDENVVPQIMHFRNNGGRISDLEHAIIQQSDAFRVELDRFLESAREDFSRSVAEGISGIIGRKLSAIEMRVDSDMLIKPEIYRGALDATVTERITEGISLAVTAAVAATIGTLSGGFGKVLGIAIVSTLLHTTGPVGFIIGALVGLLLGGSASILAKEKITDAVKNQHFPGFSTRLLLGEAKMNRMIEEGRTRVHSLLKAQIEDTVMPYTAEITNQILSNFSSVRNTVR